MNQLTYAVRGSNQINRNGRDVDGRPSQKCNFKSHRAWSYPSLVGLCCHNLLFGMILQDRCFYLHAIFVNILWFFK